MRGAAAGCCVHMRGRFLVDSGGGCSTFEGYEVPGEIMTSAAPCRSADRM